jgi:hypothetical protein
MGPARVGVNPITLSADRETLFLRRRFGGAPRSSRQNFFNKPRKL